MAALGMRDPQKFVDHVFDWLHTIEEIAADPTALAENRIETREILEDWAILCRAELPATIKALVRLAESAEAADVRNDAKCILREVTERLPAASATAQ